MTPSLRRYKTRPAHLLTGHTGTKLAQHRPFIGTSGTKLAQHTKKRQFWALFRLQGEYSHARGSPKQSRAKIVTHRARKHERLERKIAPARGAKGRRETFFAHARSQEPFLAHFNRAGAIFLSLRMHAKHWSNPLGRYFFQDQTKTTDRASDPDAPKQTPATWRRRRDARRRARRAQHGGGEGGRAREHTRPKPHPIGGHRVACGGCGTWTAPQAPPVWRAPEGPEGTGGLRGAAPNAVRTPSLAGGRGLRRPEHPWGDKHPHETRPRPVSRPRPRRAQSALLSRASASNQAVMST